MLVQIRVIFYERLKNYFLVQYNCNQSEITLTKDYFWGPKNNVLSATINRLAALKLLAKSVKKLVYYCVCSFVITILMRYVGMISESDTFWKLTIY